MACNMEGAVTGRVLQRPQQSWRRSSRVALSIYLGVTSTVLAYTRLKMLLWNNIEIIIIRMVLESREQSLQLMSSMVNNSRTDRWRE